MSAALPAIPFLLLLLAIAVLPLAAPRFWESNRNKALCAAACAIPVAGWLMWHAPHALAHALQEYGSFIVLLGALFVIAGGIYITGDLRATPRVNTAFLAIGALLANLIGTTGASMVLIRPFLRTNSERRNVRHLPIFFIFLVSNCGGLLTPIGDPPLFLGFLRGVPFFWTLKLFPIWATTVGALLAIFYVWDRAAYARERAEDLRRDIAQVANLRMEGRRHLAFLLGVIGAVFMASPWRELLMLALAAGSLAAGPRAARRRNHFTWHPIAEVAILFAGIFVTMAPALALLKTHAAAFGITTPGQFFWATGMLSSVLDNAPTYLTFFSVANGLGLAPEIVGMPEAILAAISVGAVFMGANTYIGNGPNFMVKAIADHAGFRMPSFFGYIGYAACILCPLYGAIHWLFF
ncbi:MAG: sodium:proton antiporter [Deltaproteobacteria bacterium]|nr:sodium:proton antiporter [Deltaproteobacteria bacterium]